MPGPRPRPSAGVFPYTTLFRSRVAHLANRRADLGALGAGWAGRVQAHGRVEGDRARPALTGEIDAADVDVDGYAATAATARSAPRDRKSTGLNSSHVRSSYAGASATSERWRVPVHDALPISRRSPGESTRRPRRAGGRLGGPRAGARPRRGRPRAPRAHRRDRRGGRRRGRLRRNGRDCPQRAERSEEHRAELQSRPQLVCRGLGHVRALACSRTRRSSDLASLTWRIDAPTSARWGPAGRAACRRTAASRATARAPRSPARSTRRTSTWTATPQRPRLPAARREIGRAQG